MAQSRLGAKNDAGIGDRGGDLGAWNKLQLGWLDYEMVVAGADDRRSTLGPQEYNSDKAQAVVVVLPKKTVVTELGAPSPGHEAVLLRQRRRPRQHDDPSGRPDRPAAGGPDVPGPLRHRGLRTGRRATTRYVEVDDGSGFTGHRRQHRQRRPRATASTARRRRLRAGHVRPVGLRRQDGRPAVPLRHRRRAAGNDPAVPDGFFVDDIAGHRGGATVFTDGAEAGHNGWTLDGFSVVGRRPPELFDNYYIAGHRTYVSYDQYLKTGPYYFGYANTKPDWVDHYAYQQGLLISYWDTSYTDNDTFAHPGNGRNLYIDAHPAPFYRLDGLPWRARMQVYDAPFGLTQGRLVHAARQRRSRSTSGARPPSRCSTTPRSTGTRSCPTTASSCRRSASRSGYWTSTARR